MHMQCYVTSSVLEQIFLVHCKCLVGSVKLLPPDAL